jgi:hypothetical protein
MPEAESWSHAAAETARACVDPVTDEQKKHAEDHHRLGTANSHIRSQLSDRQSCSAGVDATDIADLTVERANVYDTSVAAQRFPGMVTQGSSQHFLFDFKTTKRQFIHIASAEDYETACHPSPERLTGTMTASFKDGATGLQFQANLQVQLDIKDEADGLAHYDLSGTATISPTSYQWVVIKDPCTCTISSASTSAKAVCLLRRCDKQAVVAVGAQWKSTCMCGDLAVPGAVSLVGTSGGFLPVDTIGVWQGTHATGDTTLSWDLRAP